MPIMILKYLRLNREVVEVTGMIQTEHTLETSISTLREISN